MLKTPKEIAAEYGFSTSHIRKLICQGRIKAEKIGRFYAINPDKMKDIQRRRQPNNVKKDLSNGSNQ